MVELKSIEQLLHFMKNHIHLSRYDEKFIENISTLKQVTTNQVVLFHSLVAKYRRQFTKHELNPDTLFDLPWNVTVVESSPKFTDGHIEIVDGMIYFKCPFSRKFIEDFRKQNLNQFVFDNTNRRYEAPYNQYLLKILLKTATKFFNSVNLCPITQQLLADVKLYEDATYWTPTLVKLNGRLYILGMNQALNDALGDIVLNTELKTLATIAGYGVTIDKNLYDSNTLAENIACNYVTTVEQSAAKEMVDILYTLGCDVVYISGAGLLNIAKKAIVHELSEKQIKFVDMNLAVDSGSNYKFPVMIKLRKNVLGVDQDPYKVCKVIHIVNSLPIEIK